MPITDDAASTADKEEQMHQLFQPGPNAPDAPADPPSRKDQIKIFAGILAGTVLIMLYAGGVLPF